MLFQLRSHQPCRLLQDIWHKEQSSLSWAAAVSAEHAWGTAEKTGLMTTRGQTASPGRSGAASGSLSSGGDQLRQAAVTSAPSPLRQHQVRPGTGTQKRAATSSTSQGGTGELWLC